MDKYNTEKMVAALILAAGRSSRMQHGQESDHKLLLPLGQGTILSHVIAATLASQARPIILVLGYQSEQVRASLAPYLNTLPDTVHSDIIIIENAAYAQGMSTSLHKGIQILMNQNTPAREETSSIGAKKSCPEGAPPGMKTKFQKNLRVQCTCGDERPQGTRGAEPVVYTSFEHLCSKCVDDGFTPSPGRGQPYPPLRASVPTPHTHQALEFTSIGASPAPTSECAGVLVLLADQPLITSALLDQLIEMKYTTGKRIIAPFYNGRRRNPVLFDASLFPELLTMTGDEGARSVIEKYSTEVERLDIDDARLWYDVDTWEAYQEVLRVWGWGDNKDDQKAFR
jgi:CTP:molybdopterin cytidylyltransferase MocA